jgi:hypothetical protein
MTERRAERDSPLSQPSETRTLFHPDAEGAPSPESNRFSSEEEDEGFFDSEADARAGGSDLEGSETSVGEGSHAGTPSAIDYVEVHVSSCRAPRQVTALYGQQLAGVCGTSRTGPNACVRKNHVSKRGTDQEYPPGFYRPITSSKNQISEHGRADRPHLTLAEHAALVRAEREEMEDMAQAMESEEEEDELPRRSSPASRITFAPKSILRETNQAPAATDPPGLPRLIRQAQEARDALGLSLAAHAPAAPKKSHRQPPPPVETVEESSGSEASLVDLTIRTRKKSAAQGKAKKAPSSPSTRRKQPPTSAPKIWYGLERKRTRVICTSASKKATYESLGYSLVGAFYSAQVAEDW